MAKGSHSYIVRYNVNGRVCHYSEYGHLSESQATVFENRKDAEKVAAALAVKGYRKVSIVKVGLRRR